ncbi:hypothetical protein RF11_07770 [Thelohanellus kitauei]|uniref:Uncharacterized protein n=1 Tax=Thelohanellus kitauei TaxID=669202 RepID=A0A0C2NEQ9_THEKT|nr:hypothetical protein RF11_07770 [Thelohanellus kitauei]
MNTLDIDWHKLEQERYECIHYRFRFLERSWPVIREHLLHIKASPIHAVVKLFVLVLSICTIFFNSFFIHVLALIAVPVMFSLKLETYERFMDYFHYLLVPSQERWEQFTYDNFCRGFAFISLEYQKILLIVRGITATCPLFSFVVSNVILANSLLMWQSFTILRCLALTFILIYTTPMLWYYQLDHFFGSFLILSPIPKVSSNLLPCQLMSLSGDLNRISPIVTPSGSESNLTAIGRPSLSRK